MVKKRKKRKEQNHIFSYTFTKTYIYKFFVGIEVSWSGYSFDSFVDDWKFLIVLAVLLKIRPTVCVNCQIIKETWFSILKYAIANVTVPTHAWCLSQTWEHMFLVDSFSSLTHPPSCSSDNTQLLVGENLNVVQVWNNNL